MSADKIDYVEKVALFFYFCFLDEAKAQAFTVQALRKLNQKRLKALVNGGQSSTVAIEIVRVTQAMMKPQSKKIKPTSLAFSSDYIELPPNSNWGPWFEFRRRASEEEVQAVLYAKVLKLSEGDIAHGLKLPLGTIRYRIGQGLCVMGQMFSPQRKRDEARV